MEFSTKIYSRIGELMQGFLSDGSAFMVSGFSSRRWFSEARVEEGDGAPGAGLPPKAARALALLLALMEDRKGGQQVMRATQGKGTQAKGGMDGLRVGLRGNIPPGKGLSSSSTDILSVLCVVNDYLAAGLSSGELYQVAAQVEPTDPCLSDDILLFYQHSGVPCRSIGLPPMSLLYFDAEPGRVINTETVQRPWTPGVGKFFDWLLFSFLRAAEAGDYEALFERVTASAEYNQTVIGLPRFADYCRLARDTRSGLMVAHSGTIAGLLTRPEDCAELQARLQAATGVPVYSEHYSQILF